jgi:O-acetyl-ADP-ribose deacetylase (regulator of RNase III)
MGAGIAKSIKQAYPEVLVADKLTPYGSSKKLGTWSSVSHDNGEKSILNMYTQYHYSRRTDGKPNVEYDAIESGFHLLNIHYKGTGKIIGIPLIGAGLAGGNWSKIESIINEVTPDIKIHLYKL